VKGREPITVVKLGGELAESREALDGIAAALGAAVAAGRRIVVVHGGGKQTTELGERLGMKSTFVGGRRVTDAAMVEVLTMAIAGTARMAILAALRRAGVRAIGVSGVDAAIVKARRRPPIEAVDPGTGVSTTVDLGLVGDVVEVDTEALLAFLHAGVLPILAPMSADNDGVVYNINADTVAVAVAKSMRADTWIVASNVPGVRGPDGELISGLHVTDAVELIRSGVVTGGMIPKLEAAIEAVRGGVGSVRLVDGTAPGVLASALAGASVGTLITAHR
jgi:acetylglutamate kinase